MVLSNSPTQKAVAKARLLISELGRFIDREGEWDTVGEAVGFLAFALTEQAREVEQATWAAAADSLDRAAMTYIPVSPTWAPVMEQIRDMLKNIACEFRARAAAQGGTG